MPWKLKHVRPLITGPNTDMTTSLQNSDPDTLSLITLYGDARDGKIFVRFLLQQHVIPIKNSGDNTQFFLASLY